MMASALHVGALNRLAPGGREARERLAAWLRQLVFTDGYGCTTSGALIIDNVPAEAHLAPGHGLKAPGEGVRPIGGGSGHIDAIIATDPWGGTRQVMAAHADTATNKLGKKPAARKDAPAGL
jgi:hypothetical protein